jgi:hypothetical protein
MTEPGSEPIVRALRALTIAVWVLCGLVFVQVAFYGASYWSSWRWMRNSGRVTSATTSTTSYEPSAAGMRRDSGADFHDLPAEQKAARASAVLLISYQQDGDRFKAVVAEVLKLNPGVELHWNVGDEMPMYSYYPVDNESRGEGQVVFLLGSPAEMRSSYSFDHGRIGGMGDMPLEKLREMVKKPKA